MSCALLCIALRWEMRHLALFLSEITAYFRSLPLGNTSKDAELWIRTDTNQWLQPPLITPLKSMSIEQANTLAICLNIIVFPFNIRELVWQ